jgi:anionic cell wall polymer biosynthesis LytR-Cps2A-Psr (LCP) family protein
MKNQIQHLPKKRQFIWLWILILFLVGFLGLFLFKTSFTVSQIVGWQQTAKILPFAKKLPEKDPDRINILLLGIRGLEDPGEGKLLSDAMILLSIKKSTGQIALISIPRDLYVEIAGMKKKGRINFAYAHGGLECAKRTVAYLTDLYIDYAISANFKAFEEVIDTLGGVTIYLEHPFEESFQWAREGWEENEYWLKKEIEGEEKWVFHIPAGQNTLDGKTALYYVRSRFSSSDFDRMRRQQRVLMAVKDKALSLGVLTNPVKIYELLDIVGKNIRTDMTLADIKELINLASSLDIQQIRKKVFDTTPEGLLYQTHIDGEYVLLPVGDNFDKIQEVCKNIFEL